MYSGRKNFLFNTSPRLSASAGQQCGSPQRPLSRWPAGIRSDVCSRRRSSPSWDKLCLGLSCWPLTAGAPVLLSGPLFHMLNKRFRLWLDPDLFIYINIYLFHFPGRAMTSTSQPQSTNQASDQETSWTSRTLSSGYTLFLFDTLNNSHREICRIFTFTYFTRKADILTPLFISYFALKIREVFHKTTSALKPGLVQEIKILFIKFCFIKEVQISLTLVPMEMHPFNPEILCAGRHLGSTARDIWTVGNLEARVGWPLSAWIQGEENRGKA